MHEVVGQAAEQPCAQPPMTVSSDNDQVGPFCARPRRVRRLRPSCATSSDAGPHGAKPLPAWLEYRGLEKLGHHILSLVPRCAGIIGSSDVSAFYISQESVILPGFLMFRVLPLGRRNLLLQRRRTTRAA